MKKAFSILFAALFLFAAGALYAADATYGPKVYKTDGGDREVVASGGKISVESGGTIDVESGGYITGLSLKIADIVMTGVDYTLSAAEAICNILNVTGSPSGQSIIAPSITGTGVSRLYTVRNAGSDSGTVTLKKTAGTGVDVATGKTAEVYWLSTDYVRKTADATH